MEEVFAEYIIKSRTTPKEMLYRLLAVLGVVVSAMSFVILGGLAFTFIALMIYVAWLVFTMTSIEYEYSVVNTDIIVDKIMGQRKRKRMAEYDLKQAEIVAYVNGGHLEHYNGRVKVEDYSSHTNSDSKVGIVFTEKDGNKELVFEPNERIIEAIKKVRPNIIKLD